MITDLCHSISQDCPAGLNFANEDEAYSFMAACCEKLDQRQQKKMGELNFIQH